MFYVFEEIKMAMMSPEYSTVVTYQSGVPWVTASVRRPKRGGAASAPSKSATGQRLYILTRKNYDSRRWWRLKTHDFSRCGPLEGVQYQRPALAADKRPVPGRRWQKTDLRKVRSWVGHFQWDWHHIYCCADAVALCRLSAAFSSTFEWWKSRDLNVACGRKSTQSKDRSSTRWTRYAPRSSSSLYHKALTCELKCDSVIIAHWQIRYWHHCF